MEAREGDTLPIGGLRGALVVSEDYAYQVYVCDESGMPALRRHLESLSCLPARFAVTALVSIQDAAYRLSRPFDGRYCGIRCVSGDEQAIQMCLS